MDDIKLTISNPCNITYKNIILRKFFLMIFIGPDGKSIHAYIASVFGGIQVDPSTQNGTQQLLESMLPVSHDPKEQCYLMFQFSSDSDVIESIDFEDKTDSFCSQPEWIEKVWGPSEPCEDKGTVDKFLNNLYGSNNNNIELSAPSKVDSALPIYFFNESKRSLHSFLAVKGCFEDCGGCQYRLLFPQDSKNVTGIEAINWIKVNIVLKSDLRDHATSFSIDFGEDKGKIYTPDFTWYFAPPAEYVVDEESYVNLETKGPDKNAISAVSDETDVLFKEWKEERIVERKKSRVLFNTISGCDALNLSQYRKLTVHLHIKNPQKSSNRQFLLGLLVAFLLSFCSDKTRINDYYSCLLKYCVCDDRIGDYCSKCSFLCNLIGIVSPILILMTFLVWVLDPEKCFSQYSLGKKEKIVQFILKPVRIIGIILTIALVIYTFVVWLIWPDILGLISCNFNSIILVMGFIVAFIANFCYLIYCLGYLKRNIITYL